MKRKAPLCFALVPFDSRLGASGSVVDFDAVYDGLIALAVTAAGREPLRADNRYEGTRGASKPNASFGIGRERRVNQLRFYEGPITYQSDGK